MWLKERLKEKSTWRGLAVLAGLLGYAVDPMQVEAVITGVGAAVALVETVSAEHKQAG